MPDSSELPTHPSDRIVAETPPDAPEKSESSEASGVSSASDEAARLDKRLVVAIALAQFASSVGVVALVLVSYPITVAELAPGNKETMLGLVMGVQSLAGIVAIPVAGVLSDNCTSRFGMRRPFMFVGSLIAFAGMLVMGLAPDIGVLMAGAVVESVGAAVFAGGFSAVVPDHIAEQHRGRVMGLIMMMTTVAGLVASLVLPALIGHQFLLFAVPGAVMLLLSLNAVVTIKDRRLDPEDARDRTSLAGLLDGFRVNPLKVPDFSWAWSGKVLVTLSNTLTSTYGIYILTDHLDVSSDDLPGLITLSGMIGLATAIIGAGGGSWLSDRLRVRKRMALWLALLVCTGAVIVAFAPSVPVYFVGLAVMGLGVGAYLPIDGAILIDVLPGEGRESGKYMGLMQVADRLPRSLGAFVAPGILALGALTALGSYPVLYLVGGLAAISGGLLVRKVKGSI